MYVVEAAHALAALGVEVIALALRLGDEPLLEVDGAIRIERVDPGTPIASPFALYEAAHFERVMERFAIEASGRVPRGAPVLLHGYELGPTARRLAARGHRVITVLHYLLAQESEHYLAGAEDPFRRGVMPPLLGRLGAILPPSARAPFVRASSAGAAWLSRPRLAAPLSSLAARLDAAPVVLHQLRKLAFERMLIDSAEVVVGVSAGFAAAIRRFYPRANVVHCHAGHPEDVRPAPWAPARRLRLLSVARPTPQKGWDVLAHALALVEDAHPTLASRLEVTLVGGTDAWDGPHSAFGARTRERFLSLRRVSFRDAGRLGRAEVLGAYGEADVFVLPSDYEPFGLVLLEAMAAGCPVLAFATDGPADLLAGTGAGWCLPIVPWRERARSLADGIVALFALDDEGWRSHRQAARDRAESFTWARTASAHARLLRPA